MIRRTIYACQNGLGKGASPSRESRALAMARSTRLKITLNGRWSDTRRSQTLRSMGHRRPSQGMPGDRRARMYTPRMNAASIPHQGVGSRVMRLCVRAWLKRNTPASVQPRKYRAYRRALELVPIPIRPVVYRNGGWAGAIVDGPAFSRVQQWDYCRWKWVCSFETRP